MMRTSLDVNIYVRGVEQEGEDERVGDEIK